MKELIPGRGIWVSEEVDRLIGDEVRAAEDLVGGYAPRMDQLPYQLSQCRMNTDDGFYARVRRVQFHRGEVILAGAAIVRNAHPQVNDDLATLEKKRYYWGEYGLSPYLEGQYKEFIDKKIAEFEEEKRDRERRERMESRQDDDDD